MTKIYYIILPAASAFIVLGSAYVLKFGGIFTPRSQYSSYYRLEINLSDKQGRAVGINIVVGCDAQRSHSFGGSSSSTSWEWMLQDMHGLYRTAMRYPSALQSLLQPQILALETQLITAEYRKTGCHS